jgi:hypothetical protein
MLEKNNKKRISLKDILAHPWLLAGKEKELVELR